MKFDYLPITSVATIISGGTPKTSMSEYWNGNIPWLSVKDFNNGSKFVYSTEKHITELGLKNSSTNLLRANDIIISARGTIGEMAMIPFGMAFNQSCFGIRANIEKILPDYLYYALKNNIQTIKSSTHGSVFDTITLKDFEVIKIPVPDLETQKKIVRILSALDQKIELNNKDNDTLQKIAETLFQKEFNDKKYGKKTISDYLLPERGKPLLSKDTETGSIPVVAGGLEAAAFHNQSNTLAPVITISASGANAGFVRLWGEKVWSSDSSFIDETINENVYFWYVLLKTRQKEIYDAQTGSAQAHIYPKHIGDMPIGNIDENSIKRYNNEVKPIFEKIARHDSENKTLSLLRDTLLPKLLSVEINLEKINL